MSSYYLLAFEDARVVIGATRETGSGHTIAHSAYVYLMDGDNRIVDTLGFQEPEDQQLAKLRRLIALPPQGARIRDNVEFAVQFAKRARGKEKMSNGSCQN